MNEARGGTDNGKSVQRQTSVTSPRSPVKLEDYANIRRPARQQSQNQDQGGCLYHLRYYTFFCRCMVKHFNFVET